LFSTTPFRETPVLCSQVTLHRDGGNENACFDRSSLQFLLSRPLKQGEQISASQTFATNWRRQF
jgi:hypothetical protein